MPWFVQCFLVQCCSLKGTLRVGCSNYSTPSIPSSPKALTRGHSVQHKTKTIFTMMYQILSFPLLSSHGKHNCPALPHCVPSVHPLFKPSQFLRSSQCVIPFYPYAYAQLLYGCAYISIRLPLCCRQPPPSLPLALLPLPIPPPLHSLPMNLFMFEHFLWHLNSSHRFLYGERL